MTVDEAPRLDARVEVVTPPGRGAVGVIVVRGRDALGLVDRVFLPHQGGPLAETPVDRLRFGRIGGPAGDEAVAVIVGSAPPEVEIHGHGGPAVLDLVISKLIAAGGFAAKPNTGTTPSTTVADAGRLLPKAPTLRVAEILLDQAQGALDRELVAVRHLVRKEDLEAATRLRRLADRSRLGRRLIGGWRVALAGPPNVGKSRLLNALAGYDRAIVSPTAGTTRDGVRLRLAFDGWPIELIDTAGLREAAHPLEAAGIRSARRIHARSDLLLRVCDRSVPLGPAPIPSDRSPTLLVANKADLPAAWSAEEIGAMPISAETGEGLDGLMTEMVRRLVPCPPQPGEPIPFLPAHARRLRRILAEIDAGRWAQAEGDLSAWIG